MLNEDNFLGLVQRRLRQTSYQWIGARMLEGDTVLIFVTSPSGEVQGIFVDLQGLGSLGRPADADVVAEIVEPSTRYIVPGVGWADGVVAEPDRVVWRGIGPDRYEGQVAVDSHAHGLGSEWFIGFERD